MKINTIDASLCAKMFLAGAKNLESKKEWINELNVFPVPDGDTGTNMTLTIMSAAKEVAGMENITMETFAKAVSSGSLRGARGNSGVILSQLLRGFTKVIKTETEINAATLAAAFQKAVETAYKAVMKPKEGTILTVARGGAERAVELLEENPDIDLESLIDAVIRRSEEVLNQTPEMLPVLKEAGVVDSGSQGKDGRRVEQEQTLGIEQGRTKMEVQKRVIRMSKQVCQALHPGRTPTASTSFAWSSGSGTF